jgi:hypothetical protein
VISTFYINPVWFQDELEEHALLSEELGLKGDGGFEDASYLNHTPSDKHLFQIVRRTELGEMAVS